MRIALDYDKTYTEDPTLWDAFVAMAQARGHEVHIVTMRHDNAQEALIGMPVEVIYTGRQAKISVHRADVWIDDSPHWILQDSL